MNIIKVTVLAAAALGAVWVAEVLTGLAIGSDASVLMAQDTEGTSEPSVLAGDDVDQRPTEIEQLSQEEMDAELQRIEEALDETEELKEFIPSKPIAADLPISWPSDI